LDENVAQEFPTIFRFAKLQKSHELEVTKITVLLQYWTLECRARRTPPRDASGDTVPVDKMMTSMLHRAINPQLKNEW
jgi:hypothetical protein